MSERCIVRVKFTLADSQVRRAVGGFLRYVQHRDLHPDPKADPRVGGLIKYVAYRDKAAGRAELFGSHCAQGTEGRKAFVNFVDRSIANSRPQVFRSREGQLLDRRRAVFRLIVSPERSQGLDLERLTPPWRPWPPTAPRTCVGSRRFIGTPLITMSISSSPVCKRTALGSTDAST